MSMKVKLDYNQSARQLAPDGEYKLRLLKKTLKDSSKGKPMLECEWQPFDPPSGVQMDQIDRCKIRDWVSLAPNALWKVKQLMAACGVDCICAACGNEFPPLDENSRITDACPACGDFNFEVDFDFMDSAEPRAQIVNAKTDKGEDVNQIEKFISAL